MDESQNIEFKESWRDEYLKWVCGFANANGGKIYIGVENDAPHNVVDLPDADKLMEDIPNKVRDVLGIMVDVNLLHDGDKRYIEIVVEPYPYPVTYKGQYHYRSGSTKQELKGAALNKFLLDRIGVRWCNVPVPSVKMEELSSESIQDFKESGIKRKRMDAQEHITSSKGSQRAQFSMVRTSAESGCCIISSSNPGHYISFVDDSIGLTKGSQLIRTSNIL